MRGGGDDMIYGSGRVHLLVVATDLGEYDTLAVEGRFGCDYSWNDDFTAYKCNQHRWIPGNDASYLAYQGGTLDLDDDCRDDEDASRVEGQIDEDGVPLLTYDAEPLASDEISF